MQIRKLLLGAAVLLILPVSLTAQIRQVEKVAGGTGHFYMNPQWSPDGQFIAMSGNGYNSIHILNTVTGEMTQLTDIPMSGYGLSWSADSEHILFRMTREVNRIREHAPAIADVNSTAEPVIIGEFTHRMPALPEWGADASKIFMSDGRTINNVESGVLLNASKVAADRPNVALLNQGSALILIDGEATQSLNPIVDAEYINADLSPDGKRIVFEVLGGGMHILDIATGQLTDIGSGNRPVWSPIGDRIAFMVATDDGYNYVSSDIYLVNSDGTGRRELTTTTSLMEMNPTWSPDGTRIAFDVHATGDIYIITIDPS